MEEQPEEIKPPIQKSNSRTNILIWVGVVLGQPAGADDLCGQTVNDVNGIIAHTDGLQASLDQLAADGATVRVVVVTTMNTDKNVETYLHQLEGNCPSWLNSSHLRQENLIVVIVATEDRKTGIYYGEKYADQLDPVFKDIQTGTINPRLKEGNFGQGVNDGLREIHTTITSPATQKGDATTFIVIMVCVGAAVVALVVFLATGGSSRGHRGGGMYRSGGVYRPSSMPYSSDGGSGGFGGSTSDGGGGGGGSTGW